MLKSTGVVRKLDQLGRIVLPKELRTVLNLKEKDALEIYVDGEQIILKKYEPACVFCGDAREVVNYRGKNICKKVLGRNEKYLSGGNSLKIKIDKEKFLEQELKCKTATQISKELGCHQSLISFYKKKFNLKGVVLQ